MGPSGHAVSPSGQGLLVVHYPEDDPIIAALPFSTCSSATATSVLAILAVQRSGRVSPLLWSPPRQKWVLPSPALCCELPYDWCPPAFSGNDDAPCLEREVIDACCVAGSAGCAAVTPVIVWAERVRRTSDAQPSAVSGAANTPECSPSGKTIGIMVLACTLPPLSLADAEATEVASSALATPLPAGAVAVPASTAPRALRAPSKPKGEDRRGRWLTSTVLASLVPGRCCGSSLGRVRPSHWCALSALPVMSARGSLSPPVPSPATASKSPNMLTGQQPPPRCACDTAEFAGLLAMGRRAEGGGGPVLAALVCAYGVGVWGPAQGAVAWAPWPLHAPAAGGEATGAQPSGRAEVQVPQGLYFGRSRNG